MNPNRWFSSPAPPNSWLDAYAGRLTAIGLGAAGLRRIEEPEARYLVFSRASPGAGWSRPPRRRKSGWSARMAPPSRMRRPSRRPRDLVLDGSQASVWRLEAYDSFWYPQDETSPLPVLRLRYDDTAATWLHVDPASSAILNRLYRSARVNRWVFDALHRLDLPVFAESPMASTLTRWLLSLLTGVIAASGLIAGWRRLARIVS